MRPEPPAMLPAHPSPEQLMQNHIANAQRARGLERQLTQLIDWVNANLRAAP